MDNKIAGNNSDGQKAKELEVDYYSWLTDKEEELFDCSGFKEVADWVESFYGVSVDFWLDTKETLKILQQSGPRVRQKPPPLPTYADIRNAYAKKREENGLKRVRRYVRTELGKVIIITKLSRELRFEEVDFHRSTDCTFFNSCEIFANKNKIFCFSCINCPQASNLKLEK